MEKLLMLVLPVIFCGFTGCSVYAQEPTTETEAGANSREKIEFFSPSLPDSVKTMVEFKSQYDNLKNCFDSRKNRLSEMPIFKPDTSLTVSMPILELPPVDEKMIIPENGSCR